jgi:hypothetical protein
VVGGEIGASDRVLVLDRRDRRPTAHHLVTEPGRWYRELAEAMLDRDFPDAGDRYESATRVSRSNLTLCRGARARRVRRSPA